MRVALVAEQPRALGPEADHLGGDGAIVGRAAVLAARRPGAKGALAQVAPRRELQERLDARARQRDRVFAGQTALGGEPRGARDEEIRQAVEIAGARAASARPFRRPARSGRTRRRALASRSPIAASRALASGGAPAPARGKRDDSARARAPARRSGPSSSARPSARRCGRTARRSDRSRCDGAREPARSRARSPGSRRWSCAPARLKKSRATLSRLLPLRSSASIVLAKVGGSGSAAIASISARDFSARRRTRGGNARARSRERRRLERAGPGLKERVVVWALGHRCSFQLCRRWPGATLIKGQSQDW